MREFKPTYLYIKKCNVTGLKYFGKTVSKDPVKYKGSGKYWLRHIKKYGNNVSTVWYQLFTDQNILVEYALNFSKEHNIVESKDWANLKPENGLWGGGVKGIKIRPQTAEHKKRISEGVKRAVALLPERPKPSPKVKIKKTRNERKRGWKWTEPQLQKLKNRYIVRVSCICCKKIFDVGNFSQHIKRNPPVRNTR